MRQTEGLTKRLVKTTRLVKTHSLSLARPKNKHQTLIEKI